MSRLYYTLLLKILNDEYHENVCKVAKKPKEIIKLIRAGFKYIYEQDGLKFFRKRK